MAIVSKAVFEKAAGKAPKVGDVLRMDRYVSANKGLASLADANGGKLYMVTVRPPNEALWLVGVLDNPTFDGAQWKAAASPVPIVDITALKSQLKFETGKGITAAAGALGMSLQTPRVLTAHDVELLDAASGTAAKAAAPTALETTGERRQNDALLEALLDDPTSDDPRRVIADALLANNDPRGEFIALELALAGPLGIRSRETFAKRHAELVAAHAKTWFPTQLEHRRDRGFVASVTGSVKKLVAEAAIFAAQPIVEVHATNVDAKSIADLLDAPWLPRVHHLVIKGELGDAGWTALVSSPNTQQLEHLNVLGCKLKSVGAIAGHLPRVRTLVLTANAIGDAGITALRTWQPLADLQALYLSGCSLTVKGVAELLGAALPQLEKLTLSQNKLGDPIGPTLVAAAKRVPRLERLELRTIGATAALLGSLGTPKYSVDVRGNRIGVKDVTGKPQFRAA